MSHKTTPQQFIDAGKSTVTIEQDAVNALSHKIDDNFAQACERLFYCKGRIVVMGVGKSGHVGKKIAATLASTGTPAFFVHPAEASHGDLGMITKDDIVLTLSNSGNSAEILALLPALKRQDITVISMVGNTDSALAKGADIVLDASVEKEACPLNLAPTASTTVAMVMGDALAVALLEARQFTRDDFARSHPGGTLGRRLLLRVQDVMRSDGEIPAVTPDTPLTETLAIMSSKGLGMTTVVDPQHKLLGIFTDGDLRRAIDTGANISNACIGEIMTKKPQTTSAETLAIQALETMEERKITTLVVADDKNHILGVLHLHDLLRAGLV
ncbi:KpsF/GutQ family sugar-phosphate isomerase [Marinagarivorans cellulosilyticus]|uniref:Arabinose 5-phosphate isomerase n=1 Tax=Marinagarivorans cellulosilyticus TaxID=2721545 RepID=A0AAN1WHA5_9GAMM|nr:KpsF/GutQ family sugar-phosphate isomerase [Marinagarivorans cellulosilyticus]BCD97584.1 arabinose-5-phosphate isomerase [Marinagarivorans cellulosilyticus]